MFLEFELIYVQKNLTALHLIEAEWKTYKQACNHQLLPY